jgi:hypothetical protein
MMAQNRTANERPFTVFQIGGAISRLGDENAQTAIDPIVADM